MRYKTKRRSGRVDACVDSGTSDGPRRGLHGHFWFCGLGYLFLSFLFAFTPHSRSHTIAKTTGIVCRVC